MRQDLLFAEQMLVEFGPESIFCRGLAGCKSLLIPVGFCTTNGILLRRFSRHGPAGTLTGFRCGNDGILPENREFPGAEFPPLAVAADI